MEPLVKESYEALCRYFNTLTKLGYMKDSNVFKLLVFLYLEEMLNGNFTDAITEEDYEEIIRCYNCLCGTTCLIDFPTYEVYNQLPKNYITIGYRYTEGNILRESENSSLRSV